jgi:hypothetical protein
VITARGPEQHHEYLDDSVEEEPVNFDKYQRMKPLVTHARALGNQRHFTFFHDRKIYWFVEGIIHWMAVQWL